MNHVRWSRALVAACAVVLAGAGLAEAKAPPPWTNCTAVHTKYPHGVGRANAHDRVRGKTKPVTNFLRDTALYNAAMKANSDLDRDKDGVACEA